MADVQAKIQEWAQRRREAGRRRNTLGMVGYVYVMAMLKREPMSFTDIQQKAVLATLASYRLLMSLHTLGMAHISRWDLVPNCEAKAVFAWGPGRDAVRPEATASGRKSRRQFKPLPRKQVCAAVVAFKNVLRALESETTAVDIEETTGVTATTVRKALAAMVDLGEAHIVTYESRSNGAGGEQVPVFLIGEGRNAVRSKAYMKRIKRQHAERTEERYKREAIFNPIHKAFAANEPERQAA